MVACGGVVVTGAAMAAAQLASTPPLIGTLTSSRTGVDDTPVSMLPWQHLRLDASRTHQSYTLYMLKMDLRSSQWWSTASTMTSWHQFHPTVTDNCNYLT